MSNFQDATALAQAIPKGETSAVAVTTAALQRMEECDGTLGAFVLPTAGRALKVAHARDVALDAGLAPGPLHGVPVAIKDLFDLAGFRTGAGSRAFPDHVAATTATCVARLEAAGAVIIGKTHMVEFAFGGWGTNPVLGAPRNPHDTACHRVAGGSSSGSAVAVSAGMVPLAIGSDTGGSIRVPAAFCGIVGYKTSTGRIDRSGMRFLSRSHDTVGPMCRTIRDAALCADIMAGSGSLVDALKTPAKVAHIAVLEDPALEMLDPEIRTAFDAALADFRRLGFKISKLRLPIPMEEMSTKAGLIMSAESYTELRGIVEAPDCQVAPEIVQRILRGNAISSADYLDLLQEKRRMTCAFEDQFRGFDALIAPATPFAPPRLDEVDERQTPLSTFGRFVNMLDMCAVSIPVGLTAGSLPIGLQIAAPNGQDAQILRIAAAMETLRGDLIFPPRLTTPSPEAAGGYPRRRPS